MNGDEIRRPDLLELAALAALGTLSSQEREQFEEKVDQDSRTDLQDFQEIAGRLGYSVQPEIPPSSLRARLMSRVQEEASCDEQGVLFRHGGLLISRSTEIDWQPAPLPGIFTKLLFEDRTRGYATQLVRMEAGVTYPSHRHVEVEEVYLIEGDLVVEGQWMKPGDYCRAEPETVHSEVRTNKGAVFLASSSRKDELLTV